MKNFFRKVGFGIGPNEKIPSDPLIWATNQLNDIPDFSYKPEKIYSEKELRKLLGKFIYGDRKKLRKKFKKDKVKYKGAKNRLRHETGQKYWQNLELCIRHKEATHGKSPVLTKLWYFWGNHFAITDKDYLPNYITGAYQRETLRANLNKTFEKLVNEATISWAMIANLDNSQNVGPKSISAREDWRRQKGEPATINENHARELLELHTVSPKLGYTQENVKELALIMTGWRQRWSKTRLESGSVFFDSEYHQPGKKIFMGKTYPKGKKGLTAVIKDLTNHPLCREFIATKLCRYLITDYPTKEMITPIISAYEKSDGFLPEVHKAAIEVAFNYSEKYSKFQNPENWWLQMVRMCDLNWPPNEEKMATYILGKEPRAIHKEPKEMLWKMGHNPYKPKQPNGWPDLAADWMSPELMIRRLIFANEGYHKMKPENQNTEFYEKIVNKNFDNPNKILDILNKKAQPEDKHVLLFNLPEVLKS